MEAVWLGLLIGLQAADVVTTVRILKGGGRELNPFLRWLFKRLPDLPVLVAVKIVAASVLAYFILAYPELWWVPWLCCAIPAAVLVNNLRVLAKRR